MLVVGNYVSPYVRKVLACLALKGVTYEIDPITPFYGDEAFETLSPLRRIPVLIDGDLAMCDSSVICQYLEERYPSPALLPTDLAARAHARWLEEFADSRMGDVFIWRMFYPLTVGPAVWGERGDPDAVARNRETDAPKVLDYLERQVPADGFLFGEIGLADVSLAAFFRNAAFVRFEIGPGRWPNTASFIARVLDHPALAALRLFETICLRTPIAGHRGALKAAGAPISDRTYAADAPRRGVMPI